MGPPLLLWFRRCHPSAGTITSLTKGHTASGSVPMSVVGTDPVYADAMQSLKNADGSVSPSIMNNDVIYCGLGNAGTTDTTPILLAPPSDEQGTAIRGATVFQHEIASSEAL